MLPTFQLIPKSTIHCKMSFQETTFFLKFTQKNPCGISFGSRFFLPVRVQGKADPITSIVVSKHVLIHQGNSSNNEPQQPDRGQDHLAGRTTNMLLGLECSSKSTMKNLMSHWISSLSLSFNLAWFSCILESCFVL